MCFSPGLWNVTALEVAQELNAYGEAVVGLDPALRLNRPSLTLNQNFVNRYGLTRGTPFIVLPRGVMVGEHARNQQAFSELSGPDVWRGWVYMPGADVEPEQVHGLMVTRLAAGGHVTLTPATAAALRLDAEDFAALRLTALDRRLVAFAVAFVLRTKRPLLMMVSRAPDGGARRPLWRIAVRFRSAARLFESIHRDPLIWPDER